MEIIINLSIIFFVFKNNYWYVPNIITFIDTYASTPDCIYCGQKICDEDNGF